MRFSIKQGIGVAICIWSVTLPVHGASRSAPGNESLLDLPLEDLLNVSVASLFEESSLDSMSSVYAVTEKQWQSRGARRTNEIVAYQPSTMANPTLGGSDAFAVRGFSNTLSVRGVATLVDGVPLNTYSFGTAQYSLSNFDLGALSRAELIRGPGSALYGSDAFHGVIALQTFSASQDTVDVELGAGTPDYQRMHARFSKGINEQVRFTGGVAGTHQGNRSMDFKVRGSPQTGERKDAYQSATGFLKSQMQFSKSWSGNLNFYYNYFDSDDFPGFGTDTLGTDDLSSNQSRLYLVSADTTGSLPGDFTLTAKTYFWQTDQTFNYEFTPIPKQNQDDQRYGASLLLKQDEQQVRWLLGVGAEHAEVTSAKLQTGNQAFEGNDRTIYNLFGQLRYSWLDGRLAVQLGGRVDDYSDFGTEFTPRAGVIYKPREDRAIKLLYGNAFRAPAGSEVTSSGRIQGNPDLDPETMDTYELVLMQESRAMYGALTFFYSRWKDAIIIVDDNSLPTPFTQKYQNQGKFTSRGVETELKYTGNLWSLSGSLSYVDSEDDNLNRDFVAFPKYILNLNIGRRIPQWRTEIMLSNRVNYDAQDGTDDRAEDLDTYWMTNLNIDYRWSENLSAALDVRNLFDTNNQLPSVWDNEDGIEVDGINFAAYLRYRFQ